MSIPLDVPLPTEEELTVPEVKISTVVLKAGAFHLGQACLQENNEFVLCRNETGDPRACLKEGKAVTACTMRFFQTVKKSCADEFVRYATCIDKSSSDKQFGPKTQAVFDKCMLDKNGMERPPFDYLARPQIHKTTRPLPPAPEKPSFPDATPNLPEDAEKPPSKYGNNYLLNLS